MNEQEICGKFAEIQTQIQNLENERKQIAWKEGVPAIIAKMKRLDKKTILIRKAFDEDYIGHNLGICFVTNIEDILYYHDTTRMGVRILKLAEDDRLMVVGNTYHPYNDDDQWYYGDRDYEEEITKAISDELIVNLLPAFLQDDAIFELEEEEE